MSKKKTGLRFVLALPAFFFLSLLSVTLVRPDPFTASAVAMPTAPAAAAIFATRGWSLRRLWGYLPAWWISSVTVALLLAVPYLLVDVLILETPRVTPRWFTFSSGVVFLLASHLLAYHLVYRGGLERARDRVLDWWEQL